MTTILKTNNYNIFKKSQANRAIDPLNLEKIKASININNMLRFRPILVNKNMEVIDGQHRLRAAEALGVEVWYQINEEGQEEDIILLNANQKKWTAIDYVNYHIAKGNKEYLMLRQFAEEKGMSLLELISYAQGYRGKLGKSFREGSFKFFTPEEKSKVSDNIAHIDLVIRTMKKYLFGDDKFTSTTRFKIALFSFISRPDVDLTVFLGKLSMLSEKIKICATGRAYYMMFRDIYNWKNQNPISEEAN